MVVRKASKVVPASPAAEPAAPGRRKRKIVLDAMGQANFGLLRITLEGTAPLIVHRFSEKARGMMEAKQQGKAAAARAKAPKVPADDFLESLHFIGRRPKSVEEMRENPTLWRFGLPATAFKQAIVRVAGLNGLMPMTEGRVVLHVKGDPLDRELVQVHSPLLPEMHTGMVRVQQTADVRYRGMFTEWSVTLDVAYHARLITGEQLVSLFVDAGIGNGVGDWRPAGRSSSGTFGTWQVTAADIEEPDLQ